MQKVTAPMLNPKHEIQSFIILFFCFKMPHSQSVDLSNPHRVNRTNQEQFVLSTYSLRGFESIIHRIRSNLSNSAFQPLVVTDFYLVPDYVIDLNSYLSIGAHEKASYYQHTTSKKVALEHSSNVLFFNQMHP